MSNTALVQTRVDPKIKKKAETILNEIGLDFPTAIRMYLIKICQVQGIPFDMCVYNEETLEAMQEAIQIENDPNAKSYNSLSEILDELGLS
ncbi:MAG: type II toxin-antitoxin system RelB/DinJ family antitoxin [Coriobacteriales bacterium]|nr:type II toxin-antitoxin system RelB/DinJ family antitoxin [Coriobacteriales bacterium]